ncbi:MAG: hypothetical protein ACI8T1_000092 [Verrucomicrobiales bacterium]|jgi:hypothetical protein
MKRPRSSGKEFLARISTDIATQVLPCKWDEENFQYGWHHILLVRLKGELILILPEFGGRDDILPSTWKHASFLALRQVGWMVSPTSGR